MKKLIFAAALILPGLVSARGCDEARKEVAVVFHETFCESLSESLDAYVDSLQQKGYGVVKLCVSALPAQELKKVMRARV